MNDELAELTRRAIDGAAETVRVCEPLERTRNAVCAALASLRRVVQSERGDLLRRANDRLNRVGSTLKHPRARRAVAAIVNGTDRLPHAAYFPGDSAGDYEVLRRWLGDEGER